MKRAFTLVELLVVIAIIAVLAAIAFPVMARARETGKQTSCLSNIRQIGMANQLYVQDYDGAYAQTKRTTAHPDVDDADGSYDDPDYGTVFALISSYVGKSVDEEHLDVERLYACPSDPAPYDPACESLNEQAPPVTSYLVNGYFIFGLIESQVPKPASTVLFVERRSQAVAEVTQYCDYMYHPWFKPDNASAPADDMAPLLGAISTQRHLEAANYAFADGHAKKLHWGQTYAPPTINLHALQQQ
jgi:prepilin-type N-terminal cleavage/methylation domain-containing protein/prepilin-type processing-associated H-X9-DG protein